MTSVFVICSEEDNHLLLSHVWLEFTILRKRDLMNWACCIIQLLEQDNIWKNLAFGRHLVYINFGKGLCFLHGVGKGTGKEKHMWGISMDQVNITFSHS